jgi:catechol 2,3-dioxygenase-like lactoylglutathione lyase family enzyme
MLPLPRVAQLDHMILAVNDAKETIAFYESILGFEYSGEMEPFSVVRVTPELTLQLAPWGTEGGVHLAFAMEPDEFDAAFARVRESGIEFGDSFHSVGNMQGPGPEPGARGAGQAVYFFDPNKHLIEIRCYPA